MFRFDARRGFYLYPEAGSFDDLLFKLNQGTTYEKNVEPREDISVIKHGLKIPEDATNYAEFVEKMNAAEKEFVSVF